MPEPLKVSPSELHVAADKIDGHAVDFATAHQSTHQQAGLVALGTGLAGAALPHMLGVWESDGTHFGEHFTKHADGHRTAADAYALADDDGAARIGDAGSTM
ncbi:MAG: type VII secretion target [Mycobacterium sp.]